jgi:hypothetical protein
VREIIAERRWPGLGLVARRLDALERKEAVDGLTMDAEHASNPDGVEPAVVDQPADGLGMHAELVRDLADADETFGLSIR